MSKHIDSLNYLAISVLEKVGDSAPTQRKIDWMEILLSQIISKSHAGTNILLLA